MFILVDSVLFIHNKNYLPINGSKLQMFPFIFKFVKLQNKEKRREWFKEKLISLVENLIESFVQKEYVVCVCVCVLIKCVSIDQWIVYSVWAVNSSGLE